MSVLRSLIIATLMQSALMLLLASSALVIVAFPVMVSIAKILMSAEIILVPKIVAA